MNDKILSSLSTIFNICQHLSTMSFHTFTLERIMNPDLSTLSTYFNVFWQFSAYFKSYKKLRLYSWHTWNTLKDVEKRVEKRWNTGTVVPVRFVSTYFMYFTKFQRMSTHLSTFFIHISTVFRRFSTKSFEYSTRFQEISVSKYDEKRWKMVKNVEI